MGRNACWTLGLWATLAVPVAYAQPGDPYGPPVPVPRPAPVKPTPSPPPAPMPTAPEDPYGPPTVPPDVNDPVLAEQVAQSLVARAQELYDARVFGDAKQLALEALRKSTTGAAANHARYLIKEINRQLGLPNEVLPGDPIEVKITEVDEQKPPEGPGVIPPQPEVPSGPSAKLESRLHGALYLGLVGATIGSFFSKDNPAGGAVPVGLAGALGGALLLPRIDQRLGWSEAQIRTLGTGSVWGGVLGGFMGDAVKKDGTIARHVLLGASIGSTLGGLAGAGLATRNQFTTGDIALIDTMAGMGAVGGLTLGLLMQPAEGEAYSVNSIIGTSAGLIVGYVAAPLTNTTPRRMLRVAGWSAAGGAAPFLLYAAMYDRESKADERITGLLATAGLVVGAYVGVRLTRNLDVGLDVLPKKPEVADAPAAIVGRHSDGRWALGSLGIQPLSPELAPQPGAIVPLVGGALR